GAACRSPPGPPHQLAGSHRASPCVQSSLSLRTRGGAPAVAPPPGPPTSLRDFTALLLAFLTGSGGGAPAVAPPPGPPTSLRDFTALLLALCGMLPRPGRLTRQKGGARCGDSCGPSGWFSP